MSDSRFTKSFPVTWDELHRDTRALAWRLAELGPFRAIVAIARGGLVPAAIVARELDVRLVDTLCVASYEERIAGQPHEQNRPLVLRTPTIGDGNDVLVVDDLVDTGVTARIAREALPRAHLATVYAKPRGRPEVDTFVTLVSQDTWIVFPWDMEEPIRPGRRLRQG